MPTGSVISAKSIAFRQSIDELERGMDSLKIVMTERNQV